MGHTRIKPLIRIDGIFLSLEVALDDPWTPYLQRARRHAITRGNISVLVDHAQFHAKGHPALLNGKYAAIIWRDYVIGAQQAAGGEGEAAAPAAP